MAEARDAYSHICTNFRIHLYSRTIGSFFPSPPQLFGSPLIDLPTDLRIQVLVFSVRKRRGGRYGLLWLVMLDALWLIES